MSVSKHFEKSGVTISEDNSLPRGERTQKNVKRVIAAVRAAEAEFNDELRECNERCRKAQERVTELMVKLQKSEAENLSLKMKEKLEGDSYDKLTTADKQELLQLSKA